MDLLADADLAVLFVNVAPAQAEHLAASEPIDEQQDEYGVERAILGGVEEGASLGRSPSAPGGSRAKAKRGAASRKRCARRGWSRAPSLPTSSEARQVAWLTVDQARQDMVEARAVRITDALSGNGPFVRAHDGTSIM